MIQSIDQLEVGLRIKTLKEAVLACRARQEQVKAEEAEYLDHLAKAESEVSGYEGYELSGLVSDNPYTKPTPAPEGDPTATPAPETR
jgi:hypothetical protein